MDIESKFKDLDVAEGIKESNDNALNLRLPGTAQNILNAQITQSTIADLVGQKKFVAYNEIGVSLGQTTHIRTFAYSYDYVLQHIGNAANRVATTFYRGFRADLKITLEVTSMMQQQGALLVSVINQPSTMYHALMPTQNNNIFTLCKRPRSFVTFGHCGTYTYTLPWQSNLEFWPFKVFTDELYDTNASDTTLSTNNGYMDNGRIEFRVFDSLKVATGVTPVVALRFWAQLDNLKFFIYQPVSGQR